MPPHPGAVDELRSRPSLLDAGDSGRVPSRISGAADELPSRPGMGLPVHAVGQLALSSDTVPDTSRVLALRLPAAFFAPSLFQIYNFGQHDLFYGQTTYFDVANVHSASLEASSRRGGVGRSPSPCRSRRSGLSGRPPPLTAFFSASACLRHCSGRLPALPQSSLYAATARPRLRWGRPVRSYHGPVQVQRRPP